VETLLQLYRERVLPFDVPAARMAGRLSDQAGANGLAPGFCGPGRRDGGSPGRSVLTRNLRPFASLEIAARMTRFIGCPNSRTLFANDCLFVALYGFGADGLKPE